MPRFEPLNPRLPTSFPQRSREVLREEALHQPITLAGGTRYDCSLTRLRAATTASSEPRTTPVSADKASREIIAHNHPGRNLGQEEYDAIHRLEDVILGVYAGRKQWTPDLIIKAFCDLDRVFFLGHLRGQVHVKWKDHRSFPRPTPDGHMQGRTIPLGGGKAVIHLNADAIFSRTNLGLNVFQEMWRTMLHEMCHAYELTQVSRQDWGGAHGPHFGTKIKAVDARAWRDLQISAKGRSERYPSYNYDRVQVRRS